MKMNFNCLNVLTLASLLVALVPLSIAQEETTAKLGEALTGSSAGSAIEVGAVESSHSDPADQTTVESATFNPADPTAAASHIEITPEYGDFVGGSYWATRFTYDVDWAEGKYSVTAELPVGEVTEGNRESEGGIGDLRTRLFYKFYDAPSEDDFLQNAVFNLDVFAPTGDADRGLGTGTWVLTPSVILAAPITERLSVYPWLKLKTSTGNTTAGPSTFGTGLVPFADSNIEDRILSAELELPFLYHMPESNSWIGLTPSFDYDLNPEPGQKAYELSLRAEVGKMFGRIGLSTDATVHVAGNESMTFLGRVFGYFYF